MNVSRQLIVILFGSTLGVAAFAQEATPAPEFSRPSTLSRAEVKADLMRSQANGEYASIGAEGQEATHTNAVAPSTLTRAEVTAELKRSQASGEYARIVAEGQEAVYPMTSAEHEVREHMAGR